MENDIEELNNINFTIVKPDKRKNEIDKKWKKLKIDKTFAESTIRAINEKRENHGVKSLQLDDYLNLRAFILAKEFLTNGEINNENLLYKNFEDLGMSLKISNKKLEAEELVKNWYEENKDYNYKNPEELNCVNFTQMIWQNSEKFGIGYYHINVEELRQKNLNTIIDINNFGEENQGDYIFCYISLYYPAGNIIGEYKKNVKEEFFNNFVIPKETEIPDKKIFQKDLNKDKSKIKGKKNKTEQFNLNIWNEIEENGQNENKDFNINEIRDAQPNKKEIIDINEIEDAQPNKKEIFNINEVEIENQNEKQTYNINIIERENQNEKETYNINVIKEENKNENKDYNINEIKEENQNEKEDFNINIIKKSDYY